MGKPGKITAIDDVKENFVMIKELEDGSKAVGLCNQGLFPAEVTYRWSGARRQAVRDLWRQQNMGIFQAEYTTTVPPRGVVLVKVSKP